MKEYPTLIVLALIAGAVALAAVVFAGDFLIETLGLQPRMIGYLSAILVIWVTVAILWRTSLRDWARKPGNAGGHKNDKQRS